MGRVKNKLVCGIGVNDSILPIAVITTNNGVRKQEMCHYYHI